MRQNGFTLVETLVAITILTLAILAPFQAMQKVISSSRIAKDQIIAASLAQEALEYVRFIRTSNYLSHYPDNLATYHPLASLDGVGGHSNPDFGNHNCINGHLCSVDASPGAPSMQTTITTYSTSKPLYLNPVGYYTQQASGVKTSYLRYFTIDTSDYPPYVMVTAVVKWNEPGFPVKQQTLSVTEDLYDWL